jgi:tetratricopeptide (TPR) repeat protein
MTLIFDNILAEGKQRTILFLFALLFILAPQVYAQSQQKDYETILEKAHRATRLNNFLEAESLFKQVLRSYPQDYRNSLVLGNLGRVQEMMGKDMEAMDSYTSALKLSPQSVPLLEARAALYLRLGNLNKAVADYTTIIDREPGNLQAHSYRAYAHLKQRNYVEAKQDYDRALKIDPRNYAAQLGMVSLCREEGRKSEALTRLDLLVG